MSLNGGNCHGIAVDVFMKMVTRHRWEEVRDVWPDDYTPPNHDIVIADDTWIGKRSRDSFTDGDAYEYGLAFTNWRREMRRKKEHKNLIMTQQNEIQSARALIHENLSDAGGDFFVACECGKNRHQFRKCLLCARDELAGLVGLRAANAYVDEVMNVRKLEKEME